MRQFRKKLKLMIKAQNHFWKHSCISAHKEKDDARSFRVETRLEISKARRARQKLYLKKRATRTPKKEVKSGK